MSTLSIDAEKLRPLELTIKAVGDGAEDSINEVLHGFGVQTVEDNIQRLIHPSGRSWRGKPAPASRGKPFAAEELNLGFIVRARGAYGYLYFPDDGTSTRRHAGDQQFMLRGAEASQDEIVERCLARLTEEL